MKTARKHDTREIHNREKARIGKKEKPGMLKNEQDFAMRLKHNRIEMEYCAKVLGTREEIL